jgi:thiol-disulfide isomerase/thioredoxin
MPYTHKKLILVTLFLISGLWVQTLLAQEWQPDLSISMEDFQKQALKPKKEVWVIDFWASWCRPCIASIPHLKELNEKYTGKEVRFLSLSWDEDRMDWARTVAHFKLSWNMLLVDGGNAAMVSWLETKFPHKGIPTAFVISPSGKVKRVNDVYLLEKAIEKARKK